MLAQPTPFPEQLIAAAPDQFLTFFFDSWTACTGAIDDDAIAVYLEAFSRAAAAICGGGLESAASRPLRAGSGWGWIARRMRG